MKKRTLGKSNLEVSTLGLGCMGMSWSYDPLKDHEAMIAFLRAAAHRGVTFFDTAGQVVRATKFGWKPAYEGEARWSLLDSRPERLKKAVDGSLKRLRVMM